MQIDRHVEPFGALEDRPELLVVEEAAVGEAVNHRTLEAVLGHRALEFVGGGARIDGRQGREAGEARRTHGDSGGETVVDTLDERNRIVAAELLRRRRAVRDDLDVDARLVHVLDAQVAEIVEAFELLVVAGALDPRIGLRQLLVPVVLLDRDDRTVRLFQHDCVSIPGDDGGFLSSNDACVIRRSKFEHMR